MIKYKQGKIKIKSFIGFPAVVDWTFLFSGLFIVFIFSSSISEAFYIYIAYSIIISLHELGHALADRYFGLNVYSIELNFLGGLCHSEHPTTFREAFICTSSGLVVQVLIFSVTVLCIYFFGAPTSTVGLSFGKAFIFINGILFFWNLLPRKIQRENFGTDGYILWKLTIQRLRREPYVYPDTSATFSKKTSLLSERYLVPTGFQVGIEIFNDNNISMEFVVNTLINHLKVPEEEAIQMMAKIHHSGGLLLPLKSYDVALRISSAIRNDARQNGFNLVCRPVDIQHISN